MYISEVLILIDCVGYEMKNCTESQDSNVVLMLVILYSGLNFGRGIWTVS